MNGRPSPAHVPAADPLAGLRAALRLPTVTSELETLASATLTRGQVAGHGLLRQPLILRRPVAHHRTVVALDIERSTTRPDPVKAELRQTMYALFDAALHAADIHRRHRDRFADRGDGLLALIHPDHAPRVLLRRVIPAFGLLLAEHNAGRPPERQLRVRVVVHAGTVFYDANGCFGEILDAAFRLLDAPCVKGALQAAQAPLVLVVSAGPRRFRSHRTVRPGLPSCQRAGSRPRARRTGQPAPWVTLRPAR